MLRTLSRILAPRRRLLRRRRQIVEDFHRLYFNDVFDKRLRANWLGVELLKYPADLIVYQEIIHEIRPDLIVETGTHHGGSALFFASILDLIGQGKVISIDVTRRNNLPHHPRITYLVGSSTAEDVVAEVASRVAGLQTVLVTLDSGHTKQHVAQEIDIYRHFVTKGSYLIADRSRERFPLTSNPNGFLLRIA